MVLKGTGEEIMSSARRTLASFVVIGCALAGCTTSDLADTTTTWATTTTSVSATSSSTTLPSGEVDCGTLYLASGWPTTTAPWPSAFDCILDAFSTGTPARFVERAQTDGEGGHIRVTTYTVIGVEEVQRVVDSTGALPPGDITTTVCTGLPHELGQSELTATDCA
jgi:hypothetical protein